MKKIVTFIVIVALIVSMLPVAALAADTYMVNSIELNGVTGYTAGNQLTSVDITNIGKDTVNGQNGITYTTVSLGDWQKNTGSGWISVDSSETIEGGAQYKTTGLILAKDADNAYFDKNLWNEGGGTIFTNVDTIESIGNIRVTATKSMLVDITLTQVPAVQYNLYLLPCINCKLTADKTAAEAGETITLTAVCDEGFTLAAENIKISSRSGAIVPTATDDPGKFTFVMPENDTVIQAIAKAVKPQPGPAEVSTVITEGADGTRKTGSGKAYVIKATCADTSLFQNINVDGAAIDKSYYDVAADGSALTITIHSDYLDTLAKGKHTIELAFTNAAMNASTTLTVTGTTVPKTGDAENLAMYITVMLAAAGIIAAVIINRKRSVNK